MESCSIPDLDVISARALAPLRDLLGYMDRMATPGHVAYGLFAKGLQHQEEVDKARKQWEFELETFPSETDMAGKILRVRNLQRR